MPTATRIRDHCLAPGRAVDAPAPGGGYRRLFPELDPLDCEDDALHALGRAGGACDAAAAAVAVGAGAPDPDAEGAAGWPVFGQFVAHDLTADHSPLTHHAELAELRNARSPRANLEVVYGDGPAGMPFLYDRDDPAKLLVGRNDAGREADLPRNPQGVALIGDPRNDVHLLMSQLHQAMLHLHNGLVDRLRSDGVAEAELFAEARRAATWHYQWALLEDFLPRVVGAELAGELLAGGARTTAPTRGRPGSRWSSPTPPTATGTARSATATRSTATPSRCRCCSTCSASARSRRSWRSTGHTCSTCRGGRRPSGPSGSTAAWRPASSGCRRPSSGSAAATTTPPWPSATSSAGQGVGLPSGEALARRLGVEPLTPQEVGLGPAGWRLETPLWFYLLKEAEHRGGGERLGPVGGRLVGEVLVGIVDADGESYRAVDPGWRPILSAAQAGRLGLADLLAFSAEVAGGQAPP